VSHCGIPPEFAPYADIVQRFGDVRIRGNGLTFRCLFAERHAHGDRTPSGRLWIGERGELTAYCMGCHARWKEFVSAVGVPSREWFPDRKEHWRAKMACEDMKTTEVARYAYHDVMGNVVAWKVKTANSKGGLKSFHWMRPFPDSLRGVAGVPDGVAAFVCGIGNMDKGAFAPKVQPKSGEWWYYNVDHLKEKPSTAIEVPKSEIFLYDVHAVANADPKLTVIVVEGEKDVETLKSIGFVATCAPHGSNTWDECDSQILIGRRVLVIPDNDGPGRKHAERVVGSLVIHGVKELRVLWPGECGYHPPANGGDITDWLSVNHAKSAKEQKLAFIELCKSLTTFSRSAA
jgi:hypothetical protein